MKDFALEELLAECIERREQGGEEALASFLEEHPRERDELQRLLGSLKTIGLLGDGPSTAGGVPELRRLGEFEIVRRLGEGGMGLVFVARQTSVDREVALKIVHPALASSPAAAERFRREAQAVAQLRHPNIVTVFSSGEDDGYLWTAMELVPGRSLAELLANRERPAVQDVLRWGLGVARALSCAHESGILHRDVKPSNVLVRPDGEAVLVDFGLARTDGSITLTRTGAFQGTPFYAAPEQLRGSSDVGPASDVYSLGVTLFEALSGRVPFHGASTEQVLLQIATHDAPPLRSVASAVPRDVELVIAKALEREPRRRYASAQDFADDLDALLSFRPVRARAPGPVRRVALWARRHRLATAALLLFALTVTATTGGRIVQARLARAEEQREALAAIATAKGLLHSYREGSDTGALDVNLRRERESGSSYRTPEEWRELDEEWLRLERRKSEGESLLAEALSNLDRARLLDPEVEGERELRAELFVERWRGARDVGDDSLTRYYGARVRELDPEGRHEDLLSGAARWSLTTEPSGHEVHLFRYVDLSTAEGAALAPEELAGEPRLVAVPHAGPPTSAAVGAWALRPVEPRAPLRLTDRIVRIAGHPIRETVLVAALDGEVPLQLGDRLISIDGRPVRHLSGVEALAPEGEHVFAFDTGRVEIELHGPSLEALGVTVLDPRALAVRGGAAVSVVRDDEVLELELGLGHEMRATASPLFVSEKSLAGITPLDDLSLPAGAYLALLLSDSHPPVRVPFDLEPGQSLQTALDLRENEEPLPGFAFVATEGESFWLQDREVSLREYLEFLNDPRILEIIRSSPDTPRYFPRDMGPEGVSGMFVPFGPSGSFEIPPHYDEETPVMGISFEDAAAYAQWLTDRAAERGEPWIFEVPTQAQFDAVRLVSRHRQWIQGSRFRPHWVKCAHAAAYRYLEPGLRYPIDEAPHGVFDLTGSQFEWTATAIPEDPARKRLIGGSWASSEVVLFEVDHVTASTQSLTYGTYGFRLAARRR